MSVRSKDRTSYLTDLAFLLQAGLSLVLFAASIATTWVAGIYATENASNPVADIILSNTPVFNLSGVFILGTIVFVAFVIGILTIDPKRVPFTLLSLALFFFVRSAFVTFTHLGPFPERDLVDGAIASRFIVGSDFFFSGHTGGPFLLALLFWRERVLRTIFLGTSILFGIVVLLAHLHYTIDVAAAFFITYSIFRMAEFLFPSAHYLFYKGLNKNIEYPQRVDKSTA